MKIGIAWLLLLAAAVVGFFEVVALVDPEGTKMADDAEPFGEPDLGWLFHAGMVALIVALAASAAFLLGRPRKR